MNLETDMTKINERLKQQLDDLKTDYGNNSKEQLAKVKEQYDAIILEQKHNINDLKTQISNLEGNLDKIKQLEMVYKDLLNEKNKEMDSQLPYINEIQSCLNKHIDDNLKLKQENVSILNEMTKMQKKMISY